MCKVAYTSPRNSNREEKRILVHDITSLTLADEKRKQRLAKLSEKKKDAHY